MNAEAEPMRPEQERLLRSWLDARDPGDAPARLRAAVRDVPSTTRSAVFPSLESALARVFGRMIVVRPVVLLALLVALLLAAIGAALVLRPWDPFPPRGLIAYTTIAGQATGTTGIRVIGADGEGERAVTNDKENTLDHSPRWSPDGRTLLYARVSGLDPALSSCVGVGSIVLYDPATSTERVAATDLGPIQSVSWSPDGARIAFTWPTPACGDQAHLGVLDPASGRITDTTLDWGGVEFGSLVWVDGVASVVRYEGRRADVLRPPGSPPPEDVPSSDGRFVARSTRQHNLIHHLVISVRDADAQIDLGSGGAASWSPDNSQIAFIQPAASASESGVEFRDRLAVADVATWEVRLVGDVIVPDIPGADVLASLHWSADGRSIYWMDARSGHVVEVMSGRTADLPATLIGCDDLQWQPVRG